MSTIDERRGIDDDATEARERGRPKEKKTIISNQTSILSVESFHHAIARSPSHIFCVTYGVIPSLKRCPTVHHSLVVLSCPPTSSFNSTTFFPRVIRLHIEDEAWSWCRSKSDDKNVVARANPIDPGLRELGHARYPSCGLYGCMILSRPSDNRGPAWVLVRSIRRRFTSRPLEATLR